MDDKKLHLKHVLYVVGNLIWVLLPAALRDAQGAGIQFTQTPILRFFSPQGRHVAPMGVKFGVEPPSRQISRPSVQRLWYRTSKTDFFTEI